MSGEADICVYHSSQTHTAPTNPATTCFQEIVDRSPHSLPPVLFSGSAYGGSPLPCCAEQKLVLPGADTAYRSLWMGTLSALWGLREELHLQGQGSMRDWERVGMAHQTGSNNEAASEPDRPLRQWAYPQRVLSCPWGESRMWGWSGSKSLQLNP